LQATEISKLQLIIVLYVVLADSIYSDIIHFIFIAIGHFMTKKDLHDIILLYDK